MCFLFFLFFFGGEGGRVGFVLSPDQCPQLPSVLLPCLDLFSGKGFDSFKVKQPKKDVFPVFPFSLGHSNSHSLLRTNKIC